MARDKFSFPLFIVEVLYETDPFIVSRQKFKSLPQIILFLGPQYVLGSVNLNIFLLFLSSHLFSELKNPNITNYFLEDNKLLDETGKKIMVRDQFSFPLFIMEENMQRPLFLV